MTDADILALWNERSEASDAHRNSLTYVATEVPLGHPQLEPSENTGELVAGGEIVRCVIEDHPEGGEGLFVSVDGQDLSPTQFARMFASAGGRRGKVAGHPDSKASLRRGWRGTSYQ